MVFDDSSQKSSIVAAGLYNPVILKRFSEVWKAKEQLQIALPVYKNLEADLNIEIDYKVKLLRRFTSIEEQNLWFNASDKPTLEPFLSTQLIKNNHKYIEAPFSFGEVLHTGRIDTETLIASYKDFLDKNNNVIHERFNYQKLQIKGGFMVYGNLRAKRIVFAEGFGVKKNPYFKNVPLNGTKGEVITIEAPDLKIDFGIKSSVFIIPVGNDFYKVGSTYNWEDKTNNPTEAGKLELLTKLRTFIKCKFKIVDHVAGIRPTIKDRRPLVGSHPQFNNLFILNGLGTRGVMIAPYVADKLYQFIEQGVPLDSEIDINRFN